MTLRVPLFLRIGGYEKEKQLYDIFCSCPFFQLDNRAADTDVVSQIQILLRNFLGAIEAMDHTTQFSGWVPSENPELIVYKKK